MGPTGFLSTGILCAFYRLIYLVLAFHIVNMGHTHSDEVGQPLHWRLVSHLTPLQLWVIEVRCDVSLFTHALVPAFACPAFYFVIYFILNFYLISHWIWTFLFYSSSCTYFVCAFITVLSQELKIPCRYSVCLYCLSCLVPIVFKCLIYVFVYQSLDAIWFVLVLIRTFESASLSCST